MGPITRGLARMADRAAVGALEHAVSAATRDRSARETFEAAIRADDAAVLTLVAASADHRREAVGHVRVALDAARTARVLQGPTPGFAAG